MSEVPLYPTFSQSIWAHQLGEPGLSSDPKLTDSYRRDPQLPSGLFLLLYHSQDTKVYEP